MTAVLDVAVAYAERGWPVLPLWWPRGEERCACPAKDCRSYGKHPHGRLAPNGLANATTDVDTIRAWWASVPELNVGLRTGVLFDVLDLDRPEAGVWLAEYAASLGEDTDECWRWGPMSVTAHGAHLFYAPTGASNGSRIQRVDGFDWRGRNGYIVAPPSRHHEGHVYAWQEDCGPDAPIPAAPAFLASLVRKEQPERRLRIQPPAPVWRDGNARSWGASGIIGRVAVAVEGERNSMLAWAAHRIGLDVHERKAPRRAADAACEQLHNVARMIGLGDNEIELTIASCYGAGLSGQIGGAA